MSNPMAELLGMLGGPETQQALRERQHAMDAALESVRNMSSEEKLAVIDNKFDRALFAYQGDDNDAKAVRNILHSLRDAHKIIHEAGEALGDGDEDVTPILSMDVSRVVAEFATMSSDFINALERTTAARAIALGLTLPAKYVPESEREQGTEAREVVDTTDDDERHDEDENDGRVPGADTIKINMPPEYIVGG